MTIIGYDSNPKDGFRVQVTDTNFPTEYGPPIPYTQFVYNYASLKGYNVPDPTTGWYLRSLFWGNDFQDATGLTKH